MATVYLVPAGTDSAPAAASGDYLLRPSGDGLYEVGQLGTTCTWLGTVAASLLPSLPAVDAPQEAPDQTALLTAVKGVQAAEHHRGG